MARLQQAQVRLKLRVPTSWKTLVLRQRVRQTPRRQQNVFVAVAVVADAASAMPTSCPPIRLRQRAIRQPKWLSNRLGFYANPDAAVSAAVAVVAVIGNRVQILGYVRLARLLMRTVLVMRLRQFRENQSMTISMIQSGTELFRQHRL
jgi:hypothetical protein